MGEVRVGIAGWSYQDWKGTVYPLGLPPREWLPFVSSYVECVEVNSTFYRIPGPRAAEGWVRAVEPRPRFVFLVKLWRGFTHGKREEWGPKELTSFRDAIRPLSESGRLAGLLMQFPWYDQATHEHAVRIAELRQAFAEHPMAVELRHATWSTDRVRDFLRARDLSLCNIDLPRSSTSFPPGEWVTAAMGYVRLHGRNAKAWFDPKAHRDQKYDYCYDEADLQEWAARAMRMSLAARDVYVIANNHFRGQAMANALELRSMIEGVPVSVPAPLMETYEHLSRITGV